MVTHGHYDDSSVRRDYGICVPIAAVQKLKEEGCVEGLHPYVYSYMGYTHDLEEFMDEHVTRVAEGLLGDGVTAVLLTPC